MKTLRLLYPDYKSGGLDTYYFGSHLLAHILPPNPNQPLLTVAIQSPNTQKSAVHDGIYAKEEVLAGIEDAYTKIESEKPDKIITIGGTCLVSLAPFDYLHGRYKNVGILWFDAHPDVSTIHDGYPYAHAMVLGTLLGNDQTLPNVMRHEKFPASDVLYIGLQHLHTYQKDFLDNLGVRYTIQDKSIISDEEIDAFTKRFDAILIHFDIDVLNENLFHSTYFANKELVGDGSSGGKMTIPQLSSILHRIDNTCNIVGFTIAEYLPFDEQKIHTMLSELSLFTD